MRFKAVPVILTVVTLIFTFSSLNAEDNKNYADCDVCYGGIHYGPGEAREILGKQCLDLLSQLNDKTKTIKLDLDGVLKPGSKESPDKGFEIMIWGENPFFVKYLGDGSTILLASSIADVNQPLTVDNWNPDIYLYASQSNQISLKDSIETAWDKIKASGIYFWVISDNKKGADWNDMLKSKILEALKLMTGK